MGQRLVPRSEQVYTAFRLACLDTRERLELAHQLDLNRERTFGFLIEVPFLRNVPAQVQLDLLFNTWRKLVEQADHQATLLDEAVFYAACETAARIIRTEPEIARRFLSRGPVTCSTLLDRSAADALQALHLTHTQEGLFLLVSQFQDLPPPEAQKLKLQCGLTDESCHCLFDVLGRWYVSEQLLPRTPGLLTRVETEQLDALLRASHCCR